MSGNSPKTPGGTPCLAQLQNINKKHKRRLPAIRAAGRAHLSRCRFSSALPRPQNNPGSLFLMTVISFQVVAAASRWLSSAGLFLASDARLAAGISVLGQDGVDHVLVTQARVTQDPPELICHFGAAFVCETACSCTSLLHVL